MLYLDNTNHWSNTSRALTDEEKREIVLLSHPVKSYYWSDDPTSPAILFGGTWQPIENRFLYAVPTSESAGVTGGAKTVTLTTNQIPSHTHSGNTHSHTVSSHSHSVDSHTHGLNSHTHTMSHSHTIPSHKHDTNASFLGAEGSLSSWSGGWASGSLFGPHPWGFYSGTGTYSVVKSGGSGNTGAYSGSTGAASGSTASGGSGTTGSASTSTNSVAVTVGNTGGGQAHENMPPYIAAYCWKRTA